MHLVARIYFFSVLCLASLATPLSQEGFPKRDFLGKRRHPEADSVTVSAEISALLDDLTHNAVEVRPSPDLRFGLFALTHPQTPSSAGSTKPTSVAPQDRLINPKFSSFKDPIATVASSATEINIQTQSEIETPSSTGSTQPSSVASQDRVKNPKVSSFKDPIATVASFPAEVNTQTLSEIETPSSTSTGSTQPSSVASQDRVKNPKVSSPSSVNDPLSTVASSATEVNTQTQSEIETASSTGSAQLTSQAQDGLTSTTFSHVSIPASSIHHFSVTSQDGSINTNFASPTSDSLSIVTTFATEIDTRTLSSTSSSDVFTVIALPTLGAPSKLKAAPSASSSISPAASTSALPVIIAPGMPGTAPTETGPPVIQAEDRGWGGFWGGCVIG
ncbi:hypothetical protein B0H13DRAFT_1858670 [Mycena leptocephala]|nr:hypothetical protein B0H13DRAFT_1858670 [Mycena leptocephala]